MNTATFTQAFNAMNPLAASPRRTAATGLCASVFAALLLAGCSGLPDKPTRALMYDFGPGALATPATTRLAPLPAIAIDDISTSGGALDNMAVLYRLAYADAQQLRPYSQARWSMPPAQLVRQRLRDQLSQRRAVFDAGDSAALNRSANAVLPLLLRMDLEEFSQIFTSPDVSVGVIRMRVTLVKVTPAGEQLLAQRNVVVQRPATGADAAGGVRGITAATNAAIEEIDQWLQQTPAQ